MVAQQVPDTVLLDLDVPDLDELGMVERIREMTKTPIVVLSADASEGHKIRALDGGADDFVAKPFAIGELLARLRVAVRHGAALGLHADPPVFVLDGLRVDFVARRVCVDGRQVHLTPTEYRLLSNARRPSEEETSQCSP